MLRTPLFNIFVRSNTNKVWISRSLHIPPGRLPLLSVSAAVLLLLNTQEMSKLTQLVHAYITGTHGSLPSVDTVAVRALLSDDFQFSNEEQRHDADALLQHVFPGRLYGGWQGLE